MDLLRRCRETVIALLLALPVLLAPATPVQSACGAVDPEHAAWTSILARRVADGRVDYAALQREDRGALDAYLASLSGTCADDYARWTTPAKIAFWLNAYNAFTVQLILDNYPISSIRKIGFLPLAAFRERFIPMPGLKGGTISLDDIEHGTLRAAFEEPRIHFALVCASVSCPALRAQAYRGADLDAQLDDQARGFLGDPARNLFDVAAQTLFLSAIFDWFNDDFVAAAGSVPAYVAPFMAVAPGPDVKVEFLDYDWQLNDRKRARDGTRGG